MTIAVGADKNEQGRVFPFTAELRRVLLAQRVIRERCRRAGHVTPYVFVRVDAAGRPSAIKSFRHHWRLAAKAAGVPGHVPHDFRRTAARNLVRAGTPETVAMRLTGHKTRSVFERYNIVSDGNLAAAAARIDAAVRTERDQERDQNRAFSGPLGKPRVAKSLGKPQIQA